MLILIYFIVVLVVLFTEARDCHKEKIRVDLGSVVFSLLWPVSLPFAIYVVCRDNK
jgi:hypothetical protein